MPLNPTMYSAEQSLLIQEEVSTLIEKSAVTQVHNPQHFKMEGMGTLRELLRMEDWMVKVDLKDAYYTIPIHLNHQPYLRFMVGQKQYQFTCLPFSLSCAPWAFTKVMKPVAIFFHSMGMCMIVYIDDILLNRYRGLSNNNQSYNALLYLSPLAKEELSWWQEMLGCWNGKVLLHQQESVIIRSDASFQGWGAVCNGIRTDGPWSQSEQQLHINCLELLAATLAVKSFLKD